MSLTVRPHALLAVAVALACGSSSTTPTPARTCPIELPAVDGSLRVDGRAFRDSAGRVVLLRGANAGGRSKFAPFMPFDFSPNDFDARLAAYLDRARGWGFDVLRVPFTWAAVEPTKGTDDEAFLKRYDALVDGAHARGMWVVVDFHQDLYAEAFCGDGFPAWTIPDPVPAPHHDCPQWQLGYFKDPAVIAAFDRFWADASPIQDAMLALWDRMAARYAGRPGVIGFEPLNEPAAGSADPTTFEATTLRDFYSRAIARIHAKAPKALVFVDTIGTDGAFLQTTLGKPLGENVVFAPHFYPAGRADPEVVVDLMKVWSDVGAAWNVPVFVGEFGLRHELEYAGRWLGGDFDALDAYGLSGTVWEYSTAVEDWNSETFGLTAPDGTENALAVAAARPYAKATAGTNVSSHFDPTTRSFTLRFSPANPGISEIALPARVYPSGYDVSLAGGCYDAKTPGVLAVSSDGTADVVLELRAK